MAYYPKGLVLRRLNITYNHFTNLCNRVGVDNPEHISKELLEKISLDLSNRPLVGSKILSLKIDQFLSDKANDKFLKGGEE